MRDVAFIALGSNVGDRADHLARARTAIDLIPESRLLKVSAVEETEALGPVSQDSFLNQMVSLETDLDPHDLLVQLLDIETRDGRVRTLKWGPRTLDLDIVAFEHQTVDLPDLHVPHPELANRPFWQRELLDLGKR